jgi:uncharacterized membrane protein YdbT with pleckstrin-like domain
MPEQTVWSGTPSQWKNLRAFVFCSLLAVALAAAAVEYWHWPPGAALALLPLGYAFWKWLSVRTRTFVLTNERLIMSRGVLSRTTDTLELYRVKDMRMTQPLSLRLFGLENIVLLTSDSTTHDVLVDCVPHALRLGDKLRENVEACRVAKRTREVEIE